MNKNILPDKKLTGRKPFGRVRLEDIAAQCGFSISTVSRVLNNRTDQFPIAEKTIAKIYETARTMGYRPNRLARAIAYQKTNLIGLSVPHHKTSPANPVFGDEAYFTAKVFGLLGSGILDNPKMLDYDLVIHDRRKFQSLTHDFNAFQDDLLDGMIYCNPTTSSLPFLESQMEAMPIIILGYIAELADRFISVDIDNRHAAMLCIRHLAETNRKNILILFPEKLQHFLCMQDRLVGYEQAIQECGLQARFIAVNQDPHSVQALLQSMSDLKTFDAIAAPSDELVSYCIAPLLEAGLRIPQEISLVGFDDSDRCLSCTPRLTSIRTPFHTMGYQAAELLIDVLNKNTAYQPGHHRIETGLQIRESSLPSTR